MIFLILLAAVPFLRSINGEFLFDDPRMMDKGAPNRVYRTLKEFNHDGRSMVHLIDSWVWRVTGNLSQPFDGTGTRLIAPSWPYHAASILFHIGTTLALWELFGMILEPSRALVAAGIFAVHPLHVTAVGYISGRAGVQSFFFSVMGYLHAAAGFWPLVPLCFYFAWKSKQDTVFYLAVLPIFLGWIR